MSLDISERAYDATAKLLALKSNAPTIAEIARLVETFALSFAREAAYKLCTNPDSESATIAVRNAIDRASRGEP